MKGFLFEIPFLLLAGYFWLHVRSLGRRGRRSPFTEQMLRAPGYSVRKAQLDKAFDLMLSMFIVAAAPFFFAAFITESTVANWLIVGLAVVVVVYWFMRAIRLFKIAIQLHLGVDAEQAVGQELTLLMRDGAWVFHDIPYPYGNIDHVVIGPGGVFAIETKGISKPTDTSRRGSDNATIKVNEGALILPHGRTSKPIDQAKQHAKWLRNEIERRFGLKVPVRAVVAVPGWMVQGAFDGDCWVINPKRGIALKTAVTKPLVEIKTVDSIAAWIEDLARSIAPRSKEFDPKSELNF